MESITVSWEQYHQNSIALGKKVQSGGFNPDIIVCISRGGLPIGLMLSEWLKKPLGVITVQSYDGTQQGELRLDARVSSLYPIRGNILLADDLVDSGKTLERTKSYLDGFGKVKTAVMFRKEGACFEPDFYAKDMPKGKWIIFPYSHE